MSDILEAVDLERSRRVSRIVAGPAGLTGA